jgi:hypothetical protein
VLFPGKLISGLNPKEDLHMEEESRPVNKGEDYSTTLWEQTP